MPSLSSHISSVAVPYIRRRRLHLPVSSSLISLLFRISSVMIFRRCLHRCPCLSSTIFRMYTTSVVILLFLCFSPCHIVFHCPASFCRLSIYYCLSAESPQPPLISLPNIYPSYRHLTRHLLFHYHFPLSLCHRHCCPDFTALCLLSAPPFIVSYHHLKPLLSPPPCDTIVINLLVYYYLSDLFFSLLFTLIVMYRLI